MPPSLHGAALRTSDALARGATPSRLRRDDVEHPFTGVVGVALDLTTVRARCAAFLPLLLDGQAFSHSTALALHGAPLPGWSDAAPLHVSVLFPRTPPRVRGVHGHSLRRLRIAVLDGLPVAAPEFAWCQSATQLSREDLVAAGDALVTGRRVRGVRGPGATTLARLTAVADELRGTPGSARIAWALSRVRVGVDSRSESLLRLRCARWRLPEPVADHEVIVSGGLALHPDLAYPDARIALEYEGDIHRVDRATWQQDLRRRELFEDAGWRVVRIAASDLFESPDALAARLRRLLASRTP